METPFKCGGNYLYSFVTYLFRKPHTEFNQDRPFFHRKYDRNIWCFPVEVENFNIGELSGWKSPHRMIGKASRLEKSGSNTSKICRSVCFMHAYKLHENSRKVIRCIITIYKYITGFLLTATLSRQDSQLYFPSLICFSTLRQWRHHDAGTYIWKLCINYIL